MKISGFRQRLQSDTSKLERVEEVLNGGNPEIPNGSALRFELGLFYGQTLIDDVSNFSQLYLEIKNEDNLNGPALMSKIVDTPDILKTLSLEQWQSNAEAMAHAVFAFTSAQANLDLGNAATKNFRLVLSGKLNTGDAVSLGFTTITVREDGSSITPVNASFGNIRLNLGYPELIYADLTAHRLALLKMPQDSQYVLDIIQAASGPTADLNSDHFRQNAGLPEIEAEDFTWHALNPVIIPGENDSVFYDIDVVQAASGSFVSNSAKWRVNNGYGEFLFPDDTWHRLNPIKIGDQYSYEVEQVQSAP